jgi:negative regulator of sigma E activity
MWPWMTPRTSAALILAALLAGAAPRPSPADLLRSAMSAPQRVSFVGEVQVLRIGTQRSDATIYRIEHEAPNLTRRWYLAPQDLYGDSIITRGATTYSIDVKRDRVVVSHDDAIDDQVAASDTFGLLIANYSASYAPDEQLDERPVHVILLNNKYTGVTTMRIFVDSATGLVLERQQYASNGSLIAQTRFEQLRYTASIPTEMFELPRDLHRVDGTARALPSNDIPHLITMAGFHAQVPKYLPEGFSPIAGDVISIKAVPTLHLLYSDGIRTVSLFQNAKDSAIDLSRYHVSTTRVADHPAQYVEDGPTTLLAWSDGGRHFALVGELSLQELAKIGTSVLP